jgi:hypothetical protein
MIVPSSIPDLLLLDALVCSSPLHITPPLPPSLLPSTHLRGFSNLRPHWQLDLEVSAASLELILPCSLSLPMSPGVRTAAFTFYKIPYLIDLGCCVYAVMAGYSVDAGYSATLATLRRWLLCDAGYSATLATLRRWLLYDVGYTATLATLRRWWPCCLSGLDHHLKGILSRKNMEEAGKLGSRGVVSGYQGTSWVINRLLVSYQLNV